MVKYSVIMVAIKVSASVKGTEKRGRGMEGFIEVMTFD